MMMLWLEFSCSPFVVDAIVNEKKRGWLCSFISFSFLTYNNQDIDLFGNPCFSSTSFTSFDDLFVGWSKLAVQGALSVVYCINLFHTKKIYDIFKVLTWEKRSKSFHLHVKFVAPLNRHLSLNPIWEMEVSIVRNGNINTPYC